MKNRIGIHRMIPVLMLAVICINSSVGQRDLNVTFRNGFNFPTRDLGTSTLKKGGGFEASISYQFIPQWYAYAGWGWNNFNEKESQAGVRKQFEETGYRIGLQYSRPFSKESKIKLVLGGGGLYNHIEVENQEGDIIQDSGHGIGWQTDVGIVVPLGHRNRWQIIPGVRYQSLHRNLKQDGINQPVELNYFSIGVGVSWTIWSASGS